MWMVQKFEEWKKKDNNLETTKKDLKYTLEMKTRSKLRIGI
jgi:hypothetical protein